jgi:hypothetical protein
MVAHAEPQPTAGATNRKAVISLLLTAALISVVIGLAVACPRLAPSFDTGLPKTILPAAGTSTHPTAGSVVIEDWRFIVHQTDDDYVFFAGIVANQGAVPVRIVDIKVTLYDADQPVGFEMADHVMPVLDPETSSPFIGAFSFDNWFTNYYPTDAGDVDAATIQVFSNPYNSGSTPSVPEFRTTNLAVEQLASNGDDVTGVVTNHDTREATGVVVLVATRAGDGRLIEVTWAAQAFWGPEVPWGTLEPGASADFTANHITDVDPSDTLMQAVAYGHAARR